MHVNFGQFTEYFGHSLENILDWVPSLSLPGSKYCEPVGTSCCAFYFEEPWSPLLSRGTLTRVTAVQGLVSLVRIRVSRPGFVPHPSSSSLGVLVQTKPAQSRYLQTLKYHPRWLLKLTLMLSPNLQLVGLTWLPLLVNRGVLLSVQDVSFAVYVLSNLHFCHQTEQQYFSTKLHFQGACLLLLIPVMLHQHPRSERTHLHASQGICIYRQLKSSQPMQDPNG